MLLNGGCRRTGGPKTPFMALMRILWRFIGKWRVATQLPAWSQSMAVVCNSIYKTSLNEWHSWNAAFSVSVCYNFHLKFQLLESLIAHFNSHSFPTPQKYQFPQELSFRCRA